MDKKLRMTPAALSAALSGDLENFLTAATPGGIEAQEKAGQSTFVASTTLPRKMLHGTTRDQLEALGVVFGQDVDDLFIQVQLPTGWRKEATDHNMWSELVDDKGRARAAIFFKAAFYDRDAHISLNSFLRIGREYRDADGNEAMRRPETVRIFVQDTEGVIKFDTGSVAYGDYRAENRAEDTCRAWLEEHYPDWQSPLAYW